jgi:hypothetical protein
MGGGTANGGGGGTATGGGAGGGSAPSDGGCPFSDAFPGAQLNACWQTLNGPGSATPLFSVSVASHQLHLIATSNQNGVWFQGSTKSLVYKLLDAQRFKVTTTAHPRKHTDPTTPPTNALHVGGLMARDPASMGDSTENYLFIMVGSNESAQPGVEVKNTVAGNSTWSEPSWATPDSAQLRICRVVHDFYLYKRPLDGGTWVLQNDSNQAAPITRNDLPDTLEVGLALNFSDPADLDVAFDGIDLSTTVPMTAADCTSD